MVAIFYEYLINFGKNIGKKYILKNDLGGFSVSII